jgi:hypothetical protein
VSRPPTDVRSSNTTLFSCISIETGAKCNRSCAFCPVSHAPREDEWMPEETFQKILNDLVLLDYRQRVVLHSYNEPVRDERLERFVREIRTALPRVCIMFNTNGDYFKSADDISKYFLAGLNQMQINVYSSLDGCGDEEKIKHGAVKAQARYEKLCEWVASIGWLTPGLSIYQHIGASRSTCEVVPKWGFQPTVNHDNRMPQRIHKISTRHHIANRAGNIPDFLPALSSPLQKSCVRPFREMVINWRGDSILCCNAYSKTGVQDGSDASSGNVMDRSLEELFNDERYHAYRVKLQAKDRNIYLCDGCDFGGGMYQHNIPRVTMGPERDEQIISADMRSMKAAGFGGKT